jgi:hypothetical protein
MARGASRDNDALMPTNPGRPRTSSRRGTRPTATRGRGSGDDTSWDRVSTWYDGWVGDQGSRYHQALAMPAAMDLLDLQRGESVIEIGAGQGVLAPRSRGRRGEPTRASTRARSSSRARAAGTVARGASSSATRDGCRRPRASGRGPSTPPCSC